jgi:lipoyl(octanoyl) transferase
VTGAYLYELGVTPYADALAVMRELAAARTQQAIPDVVMLLEHEPVITLGSRAVAAEELPLPGEEYARRGIEVVEVGRGGRSTFHGPGQLVCYPILDLAARGRDLRRYVRDLESVMVATLAELGVEAEGRESGVWAGDRKIGSIGVRCSRWVTTHGLSLDVDSDLSVHELFDACGLGAQFTSVAAETGRPVTADEAREPLRRHLSGVLGLELEPLPVDAHAAA